MDAVGGGGCSECGGRRYSVRWSPLRPSVALGCGCMRVRCPGRDVFDSNLGWIKLSSGLVVRVPAVTLLGRCRALQTRVSAGSAGHQGCEKTHDGANAVSHTGPLAVGFVPVGGFCVVFDLGCEYACFLVPSLAEKVLECLIGL